jgi:hypothetical protein
MLCTNLGEGVAERLNRLDMRRGDKITIVRHRAPDERSMLIEG